MECIRLLKAKSYIYMKGSVESRFISSDTRQKMYIFQYEKKFPPFINVTHPFQNIDLSCLIKLYWVHADASIIKFSLKAK